MAPEILTKYVGTYGFSYPENPTVFVISHVTLKDGQLFMDTEGKGATPMVPVSETAFFVGPDRVDFVLNAKGEVTHFTTAMAEGDLKSIRLPDRK